MPEAQAVPERRRPVLSGVIRMIADGDVAAMRTGRAIRVREADPLLWVRNYPGAVIPLPPEGWDLADAVQADRTEGPHRRNREGCSSFRVRVD
jgi:hypothetical protein